MNPTIRSSAQNYIGHTVSGHAAKLPSLTVGDLMVVFIHYVDAGQFYDIPAGWSVAGGADFSNYNLSAIYKIADAGDVAASTGPLIDFNGVQTYARVGSVCITVGTFDPAIVHGQVNTATQSNVFTWVSAVSVTPDHNKSLVLFSYGCNGSVNNGMGNAGDTVFGTPQGTVTGLQNWVDSVPTQLSGTIVYDERNDLQSTNGFTINPGSNFADWVGLLIVINPLPSGGNQGLLSFLGR